MKNIKSYITKIINEWDPIGLIVFSPEDEYSVEIEEIVDFINDSTNVEALTNKIQEVFIKAFVKNIFIKDDNECKNIALKILTQNNGKKNDKIL